MSQICVLGESSGSDNCGVVTVGGRQTIASFSCPLNPILTLSTAELSCLRFVVPPFRSFARPSWLPAAIRRVIHSAISGSTSRDCTPCSARKSWAEPSWHPASLASWHYRDITDCCMARQFPFHRVTLCVLRHMQQFCPCDCPSHTIQCRIAETCCRNYALFYSRTRHFSKHGVKKGKGVSGPLKAANISKTVSRYSQRYVSIGAYQLDESFLKM